MLKAQQARHGMVVAPHHLASEAGLRVLEAGGNAVEAAVATAATLAVVYPHMNGIGGDAFWLIAEPGKPPVAISAAGHSGAAITADFYRSAGHDTVPVRGILSANTVAGTIAGWHAALERAAAWGPALPLSALVEAAIYHADAGYPVSVFQAEVTETHGARLGRVPGFAAHFLDAGRPMPPGYHLKQPALGRTLRHLASDGLDSFYRGRLATMIAADLAALGSPLTQADLAAFHATEVAPLTLTTNGIRLWNHPPPTQGLASLIILALAGRLALGERNSFAHLHGLVEATKRAFAVRDAIVGDPAVTGADPTPFLADAWLDGEAAAIDPERAAIVSMRPAEGDTVWLGVIDGAGRSVSMIQSVYLKFGSGVVLPETGLLWHNRGAAFDLTPTGPRAIGPRRRPFHTLNPAMADFPDGRRLTYGSMGADGQPQFQSAVFSRYAHFGANLAEAIAAPRWLLGRSAADPAPILRLEAGLDPAVVAQLRAAGHEVVLLPGLTSRMGHAGALVRHADGLIEGAADPRSDGSAAGF